MWGSFADGTGTVSPGIPSGTAVGDLMLLFVESFDAAPSTPSGWTLVGTWTGGATTTVTKLSVFKKIAASGETAPTVSDTGDHTNAIIHSFRNAYFNFTATGGNGGTGTTTAPEIPAQSCTDDALCVVALANDFDVSNTSHVSNIKNTNLVGFTSRSGNNRSSGNGGGILVATGVASTDYPLPIVAGHRGGSDDFGPENILSTITACSAAGFWVEMDIRESADETPWLMHDASVDRTTNGTGNIISLTDSYLNTLVADGSSPSEGIPTLEEALIGVRDAHPTTKAILHYNPGTYTSAKVEAIVDMVSNLGMTDRVVYMSWLDGHLDLFQQHAPSSVRIKNLLAGQDWFAGGFHNAVMPPGADLSVADVIAARAAGVDVYGSGDWWTCWQTGCVINLLDAPVAYSNWTKSANNLPQSGTTYATFASASSYAYVTINLVGNIGKPEVVVTGSVASSKVKVNAGRIG